MTRSIYPKRLELADRESSKLKNSTISTVNKRLIQRFLNNLISKGRSKIRVAKLSAQLRRLCEMLDQDLDVVLKDTIEALVAEINISMTTKSGQPLRDATRADFRRCLKQFFLWFEIEDERLYSTDATLLRKVRSLYRYIKQDMVCSYKDPFHDPSSVLTDEDIEAVLNVCTSIRDKSLIAFLYHTGVRIGELLGIKIKHVTITDRYAEVEVWGKTGQRPVWLGRALPYLVQYLDSHPCKHDENSFLWMGESTRYGTLPLRHVGVVRLLTRAFEKGNVSKRCNPHWFRHSRATQWALEYPESVLCQLMGWVPGSKQVRRYVHLGRGQIRQHFLASLGLVQDDKKEASKPRVCVCGTSNDTHMRYCFKCGKPLHVGVVLEDKDKINAQMMPTIQKLMEIMQNPELLKKFEQFKLSRTQESPADPS